MLYTLPTVAARDTTKEATLRICEDEKRKMWLGEKGGGSLTSPMMVLSMAQGSFQYTLNAVGLLGCLALSTHTPP